jgi:hypothetical protein
MLTTGATMLATAGVAGAASLWWVQRNHNVKKRIPHFSRAKSLLAAQQRAFYDALINAVGTQPLVFARVNLAHLVQHPGDDPNYQAHWRRVCRRWLDFVICSPSSVSPILAIKLETRLERKRRTLGGIDVLDDTLSSARIPLLRVTLADQYDPTELMEKIKWVLIGEKQKTDSELFETKEIPNERSDIPSIIEFARKRLPTFSRWTAELRTATTVFARSVTRH